MKKKTISEAIEHLESLSGQKQDSVISDWSEIKKSLESLEPYFEQLKSQAQNEISEKKELLEKQIQKDPWLAVGVVGLLGLIIGFLFGSRRR